MNPEQNKIHKARSYWKYVGFRVALIVVIFVSWFILDIAAGYWGHTDMVRRFSRQFRSEAVRLETQTRQLVPNVKHTYQPAERPEGAELLPLDKPRVFQTNQFGFITGRISDNVHSTNPLKILFLGGSTTESNEVDEQFRFPEVVARNLSDKVKASLITLNGGVRGHTTQDSLNLLLNHFSYGEADIYVMMHNINDRLFLANQEHYKARLRSDAPTSWEAVGRGFANFIEVSMDYLSYQSNLVFLARRYFESINPWTGEAPKGVVTEDTIDYPDPNLKRSLRQFEQNLNLFVDIIHSLGKIPVLMTQPLGKYSAKQDRFNDVIRAVAHQKNITSIDLDSIVPPGEGREWLFLSDRIHFNNHGSKVVGQIITIALQNLINNTSLQWKQNADPALSLSRTLPLCRTPPALSNRDDFVPGPIHRMLGASGRYPVFSRDEQYIVFQRWNKGYSHLAMYDRKNGKYESLSEKKIDYDDRHPSILSYEKNKNFQIVFGTTRSGIERLHVLNLPQASSVPLPLSPGLAGAIPTVTPLGNIIFAGYQTEDLEAPDLIEWLAENQQIRKLTQTKWEEWRPVVTPDGTEIYYIANPGDDFDIFKIPYLGGKEERVYHSDGDEWDPDISPDGRWLVFASNQNGNFDLFLLDLERSPNTTFQLTSGIADEWDPRFLPSSNAITFASSNSAEPFMFFLCPFGEQSKESTDLIGVSVH